MHVMGIKKSFPSDFSGHSIHVAKALDTLGITIRKHTESHTHVEDFPDLSPHPVASDTNLSLTWK
jgi:hypothetical protein